MKPVVHPLAPMIALIGRLVTGVTAQWIDCAPTESQRVYYANHTSHLDFIVLWASLPGHIRRWVRPVAAADYWLQSAFRSYLACKVFNAVFVERPTTNGDLQARSLEQTRSVIPRLVEAMGDQFSLIIFPEGTRGTGEKIADFKSGLYHLCRAKPDLELVPVYINNLNRVLPKAEVLLVPILCGVTFGSPFRIAPGEAKLEFLTRAHNALRQLQPL